MGASLGVVFALSMILTPVFAGGHLAIVDKDSETTGKVSKVKITTLANIPKDGSAGAFGFAALGTNAILAVTTHGGVGPDSPAQSSQGDPVFHTHVITLNFASIACASGVEVATITFAEVGQVNVNKNRVSVSAIPVSATGEMTGTVASFNLSVIGPANAPTNVCVDNLTLF